MDEIYKEINIPKDKLLYTELTSCLNVVRGTYAHPMLITHIASWISLRFSVKVSYWIEEWKKLLFS
uniref:KilA-n domain-containing protein n=1 Tax=Borely moumouvirus TaxID=2712067 RepID=A0A6G6ACJ3_9VIRU